MCLPDAPPPLLEGGNNFIDFVGRSRIIYPFC